MNNRKGTNISCIIARMRYLTPKNRAILREMVISDFKIRYQGSVLGYLWTLLKPLFIFLVLYIVFAVIFKAGKGIPNYPIYLFLGIMLWGFFSEVTQSSLRVVVDRGDLIRKINISRWLLVISASFSALINLIFNLVVLLIFAVISGMHFPITSLALPIFVVEVYLFSLGLAFCLSTLYVKYRDVSYVWDVVLQAGFYATPILYPLGLVTNDTMQKIIISSPLAQAIQGARSTFVSSETLTISKVFGESWALLIPISIVALTLAGGVLYFKKESKYFAENL